MDTSETYIKMCEKAEEIQKLRPLNFNDCYYAEWSEPIGWESDYERNNHNPAFLPHYEIDTWCQGCAEEYGNESKESYVWLPRQDQLQEMVTDKFNDYPNAMHGMLLEFHFFTSGEESNQRKLISMEQLWLAFVMKELYGKSWDGEQW